MVAEVLYACNIHKCIITFKDVHYLYVSTYPLDLTVIEEAPMYNVSLSMFYVRTCPCHYYVCVYDVTLVTYIVHFI